MGISQFPAASTGGGLSNDFIIDKNNTTNSTFLLGREFDAGGYAITTSDSDSTFDIYLINTAGSSVGYTNGSSIVASGAFDSVVAYGLGTATTVQFQYRGPSSSASTSGLEVGAGPFLTSVTPADLPNIDDTTTVIGGNFSTAVAITFESGTVVLPAKNIVRTDSTALVVTRPDNLIQDNAPYNLRAVNTGITSPTGSNANLLTGTVTAGADPTFITPSLITGAGTGVAFSTSILVSDSDGTVVNWAITSGTIPPGLSLATATGAISGTPTTNGDYYFTVRITDDGQNTNSREFNLPVGFVFSGANSTVVGGTSYYWWTASGTAIYKNATSKSLPYVIIAGGGPGGRGGGGQSGGGGGAGGLLFGTATLNGAGTAAVTVGAGGASAGDANAVGSNGNNSIIATIGTGIGGGAGGYRNSNISDGNGQPGGSGGGQASTGSGFGTGTPGQGFAGGASTGGGGGAAGTGLNPNGGPGRDFGAWASAINIIYNAGFFSGGGAGGNTGTGGAGGGGNSNASGSANSGGGGGASASTTQGNGGSGLVMVRFT